MTAPIVRRNSALATASLCVALASAVPLVVTPRIVSLGLMGCMVAVVLGAVALSNIAKDKTLVGRGMAVTAVTVGLVFLCMIAVIWVQVVATTGRP